MMLHISGQRDLEGFEVRLYGEQVKVGFLYAYLYPMKPMKLNSFCEHVL